MTTQTVSPESELPELRTALISNAPSLSELSNLEYHIGYLAGSPDRIFIRLWKNSGNGKFNTDWIALADIEKVLADVPADKSFSADALAPMFLHRSVNSRYFTIACLLHAGLLRRTEEGYIRHTPTQWLSELQALIEAGTHVPSMSMGKSSDPVTTMTPKASGAAKKSPKKTAVLTAHA